VKGLLILDGRKLLYGEEDEGENGYRKAAKMTFSALSERLSFLSC
jgi:hypothetical protein